ncbi:MAG: 23S rRNA (guanosine(2251)-2'-O)-methyltransferase RlmB [Xanthomonadales bacterium]|nr:23S rRNA (guanosine(2251)-2'-O)-methyltransferase RlmB [Xanthomonadales bacterium]
MNAKRSEASQAQVLAGIQPVATALRTNPASITGITITEGTRNRRVHDLVMLAKDAGITVREDRREWLDELAGFDHHQDIVAQLQALDARVEADLLPLLQAADGDPLVLVLDGVEDPHNLGACLRSAEAAGVHAVVVPRDRAVGLTPVVRKASVGASELVPLFQVTNLARTLRALKDAGIWIAGTTGEADVSVYDQDLTGPLALVMGGEGKGIRRLTAETCDHLVRIPMAGAIESLNVSVATGVCLFEIQRQRHAR